MSAFFGLDPSDRETLLLEPWYLINKHMHGVLSWESYCNFYVSYRRWLMDRIRQDLEEQSKHLKQQQASSKASHGRTTPSHTGGKRMF